MTSAQRCCAQIVQLHRICATSRPVHGVVRVSRAHFKPLRFCRALFLYKATMPAIVLDSPFRLSIKLNPKLLHLLQPVPQPRADHVPFVANRGSCAAVVALLSHRNPTSRLGWPLSLPLPS